MTLADHVKISRRFQRAIRLDTDIEKSDALNGFICQRSAAECLQTMAAHVARSTHRAFTWTGPYGGGKSSLAVALAALVGPKNAARSAAMEAVGPATARVVADGFGPSKRGWLVVPVVGRKSDPVADIGRALEEARRRDRSGGGRPRGEVASGRELIDRIVQEAEQRGHDGVLLVIDEMGKFLEGAGESGDIYFFQELAEAAGRAKGRIVVIGILHQAFEQYASRLGRSTRDEWAKIQGRFIDIPLISGVDEVIGLLGRAVVSERRHPSTAEAAEAIAQSIRTRRPGSAPDLGKRLDACWPLHPVTAALLGPMSRRRFGQNERSVFGFLASAEPGGFQDFIRTTQERSGELFGPDRLWNYLRTNLEPAILASNDSHRWAQAVDAVERCEVRGSDLHVRLAKSVALIDMFRNGSGLAADRVTIGACAPDATKAEIDRALNDLEKFSVAVFRKHLNAWTIYAGSDFDIDAAVAGAIAQSTGLDLARLAKLAGLQPVLAKRHYYQTGTLRWFQTELIDLDSPRHEKSHAGDEAGRFRLVISVDEADRKAAATTCREASSAAGGTLDVVGLPRNAQRIRELGSELIALETVRSNRPELEGDAVARREIAARSAAVSAGLEEEFRVAFAGADWFAAGERLEPRSGGSLSRLASDLADLRFGDAPHIKSELLNRQRPSSNTQGGVRELIKAMIANPEKEFLGIEGFPIERGLYSTFLSASALHRESEKGGFGFFKPGNTKIGKTFKPAWDAADQLLRSDGAPVPLGRLYARWSAPPFGIRRGVMPILAVAYIMTNRDRIAVYAEGRFQTDVNDYFADILLQDEDLIALRGIEIDHFRGALLDGVAEAIEAVTGQTGGRDALDLARRLVRLVRDLPPWTKKTLGLSQKTADVRHVLMLADDPHKALFEDLPAIFEGGDAKVVGDGIATALRELTSAYPDMLGGLERKMLNALGYADEVDLEDLRSRARNVRDLTGDLLADAFAARLATYEGQQSEIESIAGLVTRPVRDWSDRDPDQATLALADFALKFRRAEALARVKDRKPTSEAIAVVIGTGESGKELFEEFEVAERDRRRVTELAEELSQVLSRFGANRNIALAALAEAGLVAFGAGGAPLGKVG
ncbi:ATP-binding protein [Bradyrhizobium sp. SZCCHNRI20481]|uniref:ATP-binding protein n=1 Tax=Bradyrhizobium sp. SZCCHNRI20481 TaxID=3057286 RepID=UPI00291639DE|nr:ATP-binding protein [Bradyrhizobium sp. SZCCHNRI20481]